MTAYRPLSEGWTLTPAPEADVPVDQPVPATVPGCVHTDLLAAGLIPDPYDGDNEAKLGWIGESGWSYETTFAWTDEGASNVDLVCEGLDTVATVTLNGVRLGQTANMHRSYRLPATEALREGENRLTVEFESPLRYAERNRELVGDRPHAYQHPINQIRKMACNFGWDWGPTLITAGIWRPIGLDTWSQARLASVRPVVSVDGTVVVRADLERAGDQPLLLTATVAGVRASVTVEQDVELSLTVPDPKVWWPHGHGDQPLYKLDVTLSTLDGTELDRWTRRIGFRSVALDTSADAHGSAYTLAVNDVPLFVRGTNWIPDDCFPSRITRERYEQRLRQARDAGVTYLRVWGGGIYESDDFYDVADELGLLVGQDFAFACSAYPEEQPLHDEVVAEARENVVRLSAHPSLVTWTGNNECLWGHADWGWEDKLGGRTWGEGYYLGVLPSIVAELDPSRPYWPGSPYSGSMDRHPNDPDHGTTHQWDVWWKDDDYAGYRASVPRFVSEFGFQGPPNWPTLRYGYHQKAVGGDGKIARALAAYLPDPADEDDRHWLTQLNQARAIGLAVEHYRSYRGRCMGTVVWQLNDCWPVASWSAIDGEGRLKLLWHALKHSYAPRLLTIQPREDGLALVAVNDGADPWQQTVRVRRVALDGTELAASDVAVDVPPGTATTLPLSAELAEPGEVLLVAGGAVWTFVPDRDLPYPPADYDATVEETSDGARVVVTARSVLRDLTLFPDRLDPSATVDTAMVTLLPGESATFVVRSDTPLGPTALTSRPVLRAVNDHVRFSHKDVRASSTPHR